MQVPQRGGVHDRARQLEPRDHPDGPRDGRHRLCRAARPRDDSQGDREGEGPGHNVRDGRADRAQHMLRTRGGRGPGEARGRAAREPAEGDRALGGPRAVQGDNAPAGRGDPEEQDREEHRGGEGRGPGDRRLPRARATSVHARGHREWHRARRAGARGHHGERADLLAHHGRCSSRRASSAGRSSSTRS